MNWKATTVATGATTLAGWLMNSWLYTTTPTAGAAPDARAPRELSDIVREAERLHRGVAGSAPFQLPRRNPFRFGARPVAAAPEPAGIEPFPEPAEPIAPLPPPVTLTAIATDAVDGIPQRTAVLSTPQGIVFANEGQVVGDFRVGAIDDTGVELISVGDESVRRLEVR